MNFVCDVGNTLIKFGVYKKDTLICFFFVKTSTSNTKDFYKTSILSNLSTSKIEVKEIKHVIYSSVVPYCDDLIINTFKKLFNSTIDIITNEMFKPYLKVSSNFKETIGADLLVDLYACKVKYQKSCLVVDLGTATKFLYMDENLSFESGIIIPGIGVNMQSLSLKTALIKEISLKTPIPVSKCQTTQDAINCGVIYSHIDSVLGMIKRFKNEVGNDFLVVITGGNSNVIKEYLDINNVIYDTHLNIDGLNILLKEIYG